MGDCFSGSSGLVGMGFATTEDGMNCNADVNTPVVGDGVGRPSGSSFVGSISVIEGDVTVVVEG